VLLLGSAAGLASDGDHVGEGALDHLAEHGARQYDLELLADAHVDVGRVHGGLAHPHVRYTVMLGPLLVLKGRAQPVIITR
jgi:hypothetical protein